MSFTFTALVPICSDFGVQNIKSATVSPSFCYEVMGSDAMILVFWMLSFFVLFCFVLIFIFTLFYFTIVYWFCHTLTWIHHGCTCVPKHEPPSHLSWMLSFKPTFPLLKGYALNECAAPLSSHGSNHMPLEAEIQVKRARQTGLRSGWEARLRSPEVASLRKGLEGWRRRHLEGHMPIHCRF